PEPASQRFELALEAAPVDELQQGEPAIVSEREHGPERRFEPTRVQAVHVLGAAGPRAKQPVEGTAEAAARYEAVIELQVQQGFPFAHLSKGQAHAAGGMVSVKGHPAIALEGGPRGRGADAMLLQIEVAQPGDRILLDGSEEFLDDRRRLAAVIERPAAAAGPEPRMQRVARGRKKLDV